MKNQLFCDSCESSCNGWRSYIMVVPPCYWLPNSMDIFKQVHLLSHVAFLGCTIKWTFPNNFLNSVVSQKIGNATDNFTVTEETTNGLFLKAWRTTFVFEEKSRAFTGHLLWFNLDSETCESHCPPTIVQQRLRLSKFTNIPQSYSSTCHKTALQKTCKYCVKCISKECSVIKVDNTVAAITAPDLCNKQCV